MTGVILNADDYAMTRGISQAILALAEAGRLSSTSAIVTSGHWPADARAAVRLRDRLAVGLHLNLTFGGPLGKMPRLAPEGILPGPDAVIGRALCRRLDRAEVAAKIDAFLVDRGPRHMIMCHPGLPDDERGDGESIGRRRPEEYALLSRREDIPALIWRPQRATAASGFPW
ncbi:MAG: ChbG/HpnK family deacetylase [Bauldia sp.]|nr:ChbG/HpnK family deacetylase [Bauldia sp.]